MAKLTGETMDIAQENMGQLRALFPDVFVEGKVDFAKLRQVLGEYVDESREHYSFTWNGKGLALKLAQTPTTGTLRPCKEESKDWDTTQNVYIEGDNLEVLKLLQKSYFNKVKMIYIDPPYNTGNDFVYKDNFSDTIENYKKITGQVDSEGNRVSTNTKTEGRYHTDWLNMMYPRLRLARNLLTEDGVIFISIDDNEVANLKKICDEIFGEDNFICTLIWQKKTGASDSKTIATITEYICLYAKSKQSIFSFTKNLESYDLSRYKYQDEFFAERGPYYIDNLDRGGLQYSDSLNFGITCPDGSITFPNGRKEFVNDGWIWKWSKVKVEWAIKNNFLEFRRSNQKESSWSVCYKNYLKVDNENKKIERSAPHKNVITEILNADAAKVMKELFLTNNYFEYSKPVDLIEKIIKLINSPTIILDFFSGSATTAHAVMQLNAEDGGKRQYIMVQLPEQTDEKSESYKAGYKNICEIGKERIRRAGEKIKAEKGLLAEGLDIGFKVFKLDSSNIMKWQPKEEKQSLEELKQQLMAMGQVISADRSEPDVVYEIMLKLGYALTSSIEELVFAGKKVYSVCAGALFICLADCITLEFAKELISYIYIYKSKEPRIVFSDASFPDDSTKISIKERFKQAGFDDSAFMTI